MASNAAMDHALSFARFRLASMHNFPEHAGSVARLPPRDSAAQPSSAVAAAAAVAAANIDIYLDTSCAAAAAMTAVPRRVATARAETQMTALIETIVAAVPPDQQYAMLWLHVIGDDGGSDDSDAVVPLFSGLGWTLGSVLARVRPRPYAIGGLLVTVQPMPRCSIETLSHIIETNAAPPRWFISAHRRFWSEAKRSGNVGKYLRYECSRLLNDGAPHTSTTAPLWTSSYFQRLYSGFARIGGELIVGGDDTPLGKALDEALRSERFVRLSYGQLAKGASGSLGLDEAEQGHAPAPPLTTWTAIVRLRACLEFRLVAHRYVLMLEARTLEHYDRVNTLRAFRTAQAEVTSESPDKAADASGVPDAPEVAETPADMLKSTRAALCGASVCGRCAAPTWMPECPRCATNGMHSRTAPLFAVT